MVAIITKALEGLFGNADSEPEVTPLDQYEAQILNKDEEDFNSANRQRDIRGKEAQAQSDAFDDALRWQLQGLPPEHGTILEGPLTSKAFERARAKAAARALTRVVDDFRDPKPRVHVDETEKVFLEMKDKDGKPVFDSHLEGVSEAGV